MFAVMSILKIFIELSYFLIFLTISKKKDSSLMIFHSSLINLKKIFLKIKKPTMLLEKKEQEFCEVVHEEDTL